jgi:hypothetical protein
MGPPCSERWRTAPQEDGALARCHRNAAQSACLNLGQVFDTALYCFGDTRAFILALLTFTALSG